MSYVSGVVLAVPTKNKAQYQQRATQMAQIFKDHGATQVIENWGDDVPDGENTSFVKAVKCKDDETVVFSWIVWPSREAKDAGMEAAMSDKRCDFQDMPFDGSRLIYGGFETIVEC